MIGNYLDDITHLGYGLDVANETKWDRETGEKTDLTSVKEIEAGAVYDDVRQKMISYEVPNGEFIPPQINYFLEAVPKGVKTDTELAATTIDASNDDVTILRIHVFDSTDTPHYGYLKFLETLTDRYVGSADNSDESTSEMFQEAANLGLGTIDTTAGRFIIGEDITPQEIKKQVASRVPNLRYGVSSTGIKTADLKSIHDPLLSTDHMQKMQLGDPTVAPGVDGGTVPLRMLPTELNLTTIGCPFFNFGQQFFVDMDTGTTVDNIYGVVGASMTFEQGVFNSSVKLISMMSYGTYRSTVSILKSAKVILEEEQGEGTTSS